MGLIENAIKVVRDREESLLQSKKNRFREAFKNVLNIDLTDSEIELDSHEQFTYDGIVFATYNSNLNSLRVIKVGNLYPTIGNGVVYNVLDLGKLLIAMGLDSPKNSERTFCKWDEAWVGICKEGTDGREFCSKHLGIKHTCQSK